MSHRPSSPGSRSARRVAAVAALAALALQGCGEETPAATTAVPSHPPGATPSGTTAPSPAPPPATATEIPDRIRLDVALPADGGDIARGRSGTSFAFCGREAFASDEALDRATASAAGPEYGETRDLRVFATDRAAHRFTQQVLAVLDACPEQVMSGTTWRHEVRPSTLGGEESFTVVQTFENDGLASLGANWWEVVRVGNAILLTATGGEYDPSNLGPGIRRHAGDVGGIVEEMCVFAANPCPG